MKADIDEHAIGHSTQVLDPDAIRILTGAFDDAWQRLQASGARLESEREYKRARDILAKYIMDQARLGERDRSRLRDGALLHYARSNLSNAPAEVSPGTRACQGKARSRGLSPKP
jgi:hypothetical protein